MRVIRAGLVIMAILAGLPGSAAETGRETGLPLPRFVSLKASETNVRRGPSLDHRIDWVYMRKGMPLQIVAEHGHWRKVRDIDGMGGWVHYSLLSGRRTVLLREPLDMRLKPDPQSYVEAKAEEGVIARLGECRDEWCEIEAGGHGGWVPRGALWGAD